MEEKEGGMSNSAAAEGEGLPKMFKVARRIKSPNIASLVGGLGRKRRDGWMEGEQSRLGFSVTRQVPPVHHLAARFTATSGRVGEQRSIRGAGRV